jgi:non-heme chloroperoxidase
MYEPVPLRLDGGAALAYVDRGAGEPVVFVPGWTMSCDVFRHQLNGGLGPGFRTVAFDPRGHGRSPSCLAGHDYGQQGRDLAAVIAALDLGAVHLAGWSYGALATYSYVEQFGEAQVRSFTVIDMTPKPLATGEQGEWAEGDLDVLIGEYVAPLLADPAGFAAGFARRMVARELTVAELEWLVKMQLATSRHAATSLALSAIQCDHRDLAVALGKRRPLAFVIKDSWMPEAEPWLRAHVPKAVLWTMPSHLGFWERPSEFNRRLATFLRARR